MGELCIKGLNHAKITQFKDSIVRDKYILELNVNVCHVHLSVERRKTLAHLEHEILQHFWVFCRFFSHDIIKKITISALF